MQSVLSFREAESQEVPPAYLPQLVRDGLGITLKFLLVVNLRHVRNEEWVRHTDTSGSTPGVVLIHHEHVRTHRKQEVQTHSRYVQLHRGMCVFKGPLSWKH